MRPAVISFHAALLQCFPDIPAVFVISLLILYYLLPKKYRYLVLLFGSIFYYVYTCGFYFIYILVSALSICLASYLMGRTMEKGEAALAGASDRDFGADPKMYLLEERETLCWLH